jgi:hypothetical protein
MIEKGFFAGDTCLYFLFGYVDKFLYALFSFLFLFHSVSVHYYFLISFCPTFSCLIYPPPPLPPPVDERKSVRLSLKRPERRGIKNKGGQIAIIKGNLSTPRGRR